MLFMGSICAWSAFKPFNFSGLELSSTLRRLILNRRRLFWLGGDFLTRRGDIFWIDDDNYWLGTYLS